MKSQFLFAFRIKDNELDRNLKTFTELAVEYQINPARMDSNTGVNNDLHFDKNYYKAKRDVSPFALIITLLSQIAFLHLKFVLV